MPGDVGGRRPKPPPTRLAMVIYPRFEGAAHRNIKFNVTVRCTFNLDVADFATNITVRCTFMDIGLSGY
jgi:hypothetical protein